ncbi:alpha/beta fold hydrolase [Sinomicrobium weinanense]|uniref:Alpha/beta hydrolase n=1 Tax=Sinomicrobium weinanense TaxID=2842200 RepID=A0A926JSI5_9FLAO|nr:alpha/beta hydrolase [Sinomicrobium weinanense]MBC9796712.1 alpha/beta hydrolase [Sinomicrobium weinanense]MBU3123013.1 alpha/beta hydrolase [Sinomicrobium weinanense]
MKTVLSFIFIFLLTISCKPGQEEPLVRKDHTVKSTDGVELHVREVFFKNGTSQNTSPLLMVHGGGPGAIASFDLDVPGGSLASDIAEKGFKVYLMNIRGWERSTLPEYDLSDSTLVAGNYREAGEDINAVIDFIRERDHVKKVSYFGWATGGHWGGYYAALHPHKLAHFISLNSLYGVNAPWELKQFFRSDRDSSLYNKQGFFRKSAKGSLTGKWTSTIPTENKETWRDPGIAEAYDEIAVKLSSLPDTMIVPGGYREESFYMSNGKKYWDAKNISTPSLVMRSELDFWSRPEDLEAINKDLRIEKKKVITIPGTHYLFLDRPERGRDRLIREIVNFLEEY